jgi:CRP-like cAMP-binding protein
VTRITDAIPRVGTRKQVVHPVKLETVSPKNFLLEHLPPAVRERIQAQLVPIALHHGEIIHRPGEKIRDLYFPTTCMISVTVTMSNGRTVETGAIGSREVVGVNAFMGGSETTSSQYIVQLPGDAIKIATQPLIDEFDRNTELREVLLRYTQAFMAQISQNVACNRLHPIDRRFARWLLEVRDRVQHDEFPLTHVFIAQMLGVRRSSVTDVAAKLKQLGIVDARRGRIKISNLQALQARSCECYRTLKNEYDRLLGLR